MKATDTTPATGQERTDTEPTAADSGAGPAGTEWVHVPPVPTPGEAADGIESGVLWSILATARFEVMDATGPLVHSRRLRQGGVPTAAEAAHLREAAAYLRVAAEWAEVAAEAERRR